MRRTFNRFLPSAFIVTLSLGAARVAFSDGPSDTPRMPTVMPAPAAGQNEPSSGGPLILNLGPPPVVYSPSADFSTRVETAPGWAVASDTRTAANTPAHPVVGAPPMMPSYGVPIVQFDAPIPVAAAPCFDCPQPMHTAMQPHALPTLPSYYAPPPSPPFAFPTASVPPAYNPGVVYPSQLATPMTLPATRANRAYSSPAEGEADQLDHILQAVHHLEAAGLQADADRLRRECDDKVERLIACLKSSGAALPRLRPTPQQNAELNPAKEERPVVTAQMNILEIDLNKLDAFKLDTQDDATAKLVNAFRSHPEGGSDAFPGNMKELERAIQSLAKQGVVEVLSRPSIATCSGQSACLQIGQTQPQPAFTAWGLPCVEQSFIGTNVNVVPEVVDQDTVRMMVDVRCTKPGHPVSTCEMQTIVQAHCGEPVLLGGLSSSTSGKRIAELVAICPQIVKGDDLPPPLPVATNSGYSCGAAPCGEVVQPSSMELEACPTAQACSGACTCGSAAACGGECGDHCTCGSTECEAKGQTSQSKKQIILHVELLELNHTKARQLGFDFAHVEGKEGKTSFSDILSAPQSRGLIEALKKEGIVKVVSDPTICTLSGRAAHFQCGAEIPVPTKHSDGSMSVQYQNVGTQIDCVPIAQDGGNLRLEFRARLSAVDAGRTLDLGGLQVPCFTAREFDTASELKPGRALVVLGPVENRLVDEIVQVNCMPDFVESIVDSLGGYFEEHPLVGGAVLGALDQLGCCYAKVEEVHHEEELQFVAIVRPEFGDSNDAQPVFNAAAFGCELGCCEPKACTDKCCSQGREALLPPQASSFAVRPVSCFDLPSVTSSLFERPLFDVPLLPSGVQKAIFSTPELINGQSPASFNFDFQMPVLPEFDLAEPVRTPLR
jgi:Flp pilus assembly secretin CpaC